MCRHCRESALSGQVIRRYTVFCPTGVELFCGMVNVTMSCLALVIFFLLFAVFLERGESHACDIELFGQCHPFAEGLVFLRVTSCMRFDSERFSLRISAFSARSPAFSLPSESTWAI